MLQIQITRKTAREFNVQPDALVVKDKLFKWHANLFSISDVKCMYIINDLTHFGFIIYNISNFENQVHDEMEKALIASGISTENISKYLSNRVTYSSASDRKIISKMNIAIRMIRYNYCRGEESIDRLNEMLGEYFVESGLYVKDYFCKQLDEKYMNRRV